MRFTHPLITLVSGLGLVACGGPQTEKAKGKNAKAESEPQVYEAQGDEALPEDAPQVPEPQAPEEPKAKPVPRPAFPGWVDEATGYRFALIDGAARFDVADVESEEFGLYLDMTPSERKEAAAAKAKSEDDAIQFVMAIYPEAGVYIGIARGVVELLGAFAIKVDSPQRRKSLCERKLGAGWHYPSQDLVKNADEDEVREHLEHLEGKKVWLASRPFAERHYYEFVKGQAGKEAGVVLADPELASLCVTRN